MGEKFTFGSVLQIIFKYIQAPPSVLAEHYVDRDRTLVYKWLRDAAFPSRKLIPDIMRFVMERSGEPARGLIRMEMDRYIAQTDLDARLKKTLDEEPDFAEYLDGVFCLLAAGKALEKAPKRKEMPEPPEPENRSIPPPDDGETISAPAGRALRIRLTFAMIADIGLALFSAICGEILWAVAAYALRWPYAPGVLHKGAYGLPAFVWGFLYAAPVAFFGVLSARKAAPAAAKLMHIGCYALAGGTGGVLLAGSDLGGLAKGITSVPALQEAFVVFISALVLSFSPMLVLLLLLRLPRTTPGAFLFLEFCPALVCLLTALPGLLSGRPSTGQVSPGGFFAGLALKVFMFASVRTALKAHPGAIKPAPSEIPRE